MQKSKPKFITDFNFYKILFLIALPITLQNIVIFLTQMLDIVMLGSLGDVTISAASLANQPFFLFYMLTFGIGSGATVLTAQYWGKKELLPIKKIIAMIIQLSCLIGILVALVLFLYPDKTMSLFTKDPAVIKEGAKYLKIICFSFPIFGFVNAYYISLRSVEVVMVATISTLTALVTNASLNYVLIFGNFGFPAMGIEGAAIATLIARSVEFLIAVSYMFFMDKKLMLSFKNLFTRDKTLFGDLLKVGSPVMINEFMWALGISMQAVILGHISTSAVAANSIINIVQELATVGALGIAGSAAVLIGKSVGEGKKQDALDRGFTFSVLSVVVGIFVFALILSSRNFAIGLYNITDEVKNLAHQMIYIAAVLGFFISISTTGIIGVLRGGGDTKYALYIEILALWAVAIPAAYFCAFVLKLNPVLIYLVMKIDEPIKSILYLIRVKSSVWIKNVTR